MSALSRYFLNNFQDGVRQDAVDHISGRYSVTRGSPSPFQNSGFESLSYLPVASALLIGGLTVTTIAMNQAGEIQIPFCPLHSLLVSYGNSQIKWKANLLKTSIVWTAVSLSIILYYICRTRRHLCFVNLTAIEPLNETKPSKNPGTRGIPRTTEGAAGIVVNYNQTSENLLVNGKHD